MIDTAKFKQWLTQRGCEVLPPSNQWEVVRWRGKELGVLYHTGRTSGAYAAGAVKAYKDGSKWDGAPVNTGRHAGYKQQKALLLAREGDCCFYCGLPLGDDITVEHLLALNAGGKNTIGNMVLAHQRCNQGAGTVPVADKVKIAIINRLK